MRKNGITGAIPGSGRKKEFKDPVNVSFLVERDKLKDVRSKHGSGLNEILRTFFNKL